MVFDAAEWMGGAARIEASFLEDSLSAFGVDITRGVHHDFASAIGFAYSSGLSRRLKPMACNHWDLVCSSWVWMSRKHSKRSVRNIYGNPNCEFVAQGNLWTVRMIVLSLYHLSKLGVFLLELPSSSLMRLHPRFEVLERAALEVQRILQEPDDLSDLGLVDMPTWLGAFGAATAKRTILTCSVPRVLFPLHRTLSRCQRDRLSGEPVCDESFVVQDGVLKHKVTGRRRALKQTQVYPPEYGRQVCKSWKRWRERQSMHLEESGDSDSNDDVVKWPEAELESVVELLSGQVEKSRPASSLPRMFR